MFDICMSWFSVFYAERDMCDKPEGENMVLHPDIEEYINGSIVRYTCKDPFTGKPGEEITCVNGRWTDKVSCTCKYSIVQKL